MYECHRPSRRMTMSGFDTVSPGRKLPTSMKTYTISNDGRSITCLICNMTSYHPEDVNHKYCGNCHMYHEFGQSPESNLL